MKPTTENKSSIIYSKHITGMKALEQYRTRTKELFPVYVEGEERKSNFQTKHNAAPYSDSFQSTCIYPIF